MLNGLRQIVEIMFAYAGLGSEIGRDVYGTTRYNFRTEETDVVEQGRTCVVAAGALSDRDNQPARLVGGRDVPGGVGEFSDGAE